MLGDIPRYARHVRGIPRKNFGVRTEKVDEHCFLFGVELGAAPDLLGGVVAGVERDGLNRLSWPEVVGVALRVWHLRGEALQVGEGPQRTPHTPRRICMRVGMWSRR